MRVGAVQYNNTFGAKVNPNRKPHNGLKLMIGGVLLVATTLIGCCIYNKNKRGK